MTEPTDLADGPLDPLDDAILGQLREAFAVVDPPPPDLNERSKFAIRLENVDIEVSRLYEDTMQGAGARAAERIRTITFEADSMTIMVTVVDPGSGSLRMEGWLAPAAPLRVELRVSAPDGPTAVMADQHGRFAFDAVPPGLSQLAVHRSPDTPVLVTAPVLL
jgi:hypothetical protein